MEFSSLSQARAALLAGDVSATELTRHFLQKIDKDNADINAFITVTSERALADAAASDKYLKAKTARALEGLPIAMKDVFCTESVVSTAGSRMLEQFIPPYESTVSRHIKEAGSVLLGKSNMDEFAMGSANMTSAFGSVRNPHRKKDAPSVALVPGGSSGGSAAAVAGGLALAATGSDTGGSIRQPAAFCGLVGFKPSYGRCSRYGMIAFASSLDQAGSLTLTVEDAALLYAVMAGHDAKDATSIPEPPPPIHHKKHDDLKGMTIGIPKEYDIGGIQSDIRERWQDAAQWLQDKGAAVCEVSLPHTRYALPTYYILAPAEASSNLARYDGVRYGARTSDDAPSLDALYEMTRSQFFGNEVKRRILIGAYVLSAGYYDAYYLKAGRVRSLIRKDFDQVFSDVDALLTPTTPTTAFAQGEKTQDALAMYANDILTVPASLAGLPAISVPVGHGDDGLPIGMQIITQALHEDTLFRVAYQLEHAVQ